MVSSESFRYLQIETTELFADVQDMYKNLNQKL